MAYKSRSVAFQTARNVSQEWMLSSSVYPQVWKRHTSSTRSANRRWVSGLRTSVCILVLSFLWLGGFYLPAQAMDHLSFSFHKLEGEVPGNTLLVFGGIQGDEPGGFNAASLLATRYRITKGDVWVVPNLNFKSIIRRSRGVFGDMNRKFSRLKSTDPDYTTISLVKQLIRHEDVDVILNLHDGSGFFRTTYINKKKNPRRWGQSIIIDQERIAVPLFGDLGSLANRVSQSINRSLFKNEHAFHVKNTRTRQGNKEMAKTLTYFAINHGKSAFGVEASKDFPTHKRAYYHLLALESFMKEMGIEFTRTFPLTAQGVWNAINKDINMALYDNKIYLTMDNVRKKLRFIPLRKNRSVKFRPSNPLVTLVEKDKRYAVYHGNRCLTYLEPEFFDYDYSRRSMLINVDGSVKIVPMGKTIHVQKSFTVLPLKGYRVNIIGYWEKGLSNEFGRKISLRDISKRFSIDTQGTIYRVELYKDDKFSGMILVDFGEPNKLAAKAFSGHDGTGFRHPVNVRTIHKKQTILQFDEKGR